jgi:hypothetical protein
MCCAGAGAALCRVLPAQMNGCLRAARVLHEMIAVPARSDGTRHCVLRKLLAAFKTAQQCRRGAALQFTTTPPTPQPNCRSSASWHHRAGAKVQQGRRVVVMAPSERHFRALLWLSGGRNSRRSALPHLR